MDQTFIVQSIIQVLGLATVAALVKYVLTSMDKNVDRLEKSWERYTQRLTESIESVHTKLSKMEDEISKVRNYEELR